MSQNPLAETVAIPFRGRGSINCCLDLRSILAAETDLNICIISPGEIPFGSRPVMVRLSCFLYAMVRSAGFATDLDEVRGMLTGDKAEYLMKAINSLIPSFEARLEAYHATFKGDAKEDIPLAGGPGGPGNGPLPSRSRGSRRKNSGH